MLDVGSAGEEIVAFVGADAIFFGEHGDVAGLGDGVATEVDDARWRDFEQALDDRLVKAGAWRVDDDGVVATDVLEGFFAWG